MGKERGKGRGNETKRIFLEREEKENSRATRHLTEQQAGEQRERNDFFSCRLCIHSEIYFFVLSFLYILHTLCRMTLEVLTKLLFH